MEMQPLHKKKRESNFQVSAALILYWHSGKLNRDGWSNLKGRKLSYLSSLYKYWVKWALWDEIGQVQQSWGSRQLEQHQSAAALLRTWALTHHSCLVNEGDCDHTVIMLANLGTKIEKKNPERNSLEKSYKSMCFDPTALMKMWE